MPLPPDRGHLSTEQRHTRSMNLDALAIEDVVELMVDDHRVVLDAVMDARQALAMFIESLATRMRAGGRLIYIGAGTSGRLGVLDASECPPTFHADPEQVIGIIAGGDAALRRSSESKEDERDGVSEELERIGLARNDTLLGIAAGGTTPFVLGALELAKRLTEGQAMTGLLTCARGVYVSACDHLIALDTGAELLTGSTRLKAGTATKLALNCITTAVFVRLGKTYGNLMVDLRATNDKLADRALRILCELSPHLSREDAHRLLQDARGHLKTALVMSRLGVDERAARELLEEHDGQLRAVIGPPQ